MIVLDIETTGLSKKDCGICQLSMVKTDENLNIIDTFDEYIKPRKEAVWNMGAMNCSGITPEMVKDKPVIKDLAERIVKFIGDDDILTYNGNTFDLPFLQEELKRVGVALRLSGRKIYDSYHIESVLNSRKLVDIYKKYTGKEIENAHNSLYDVKATLEVFKHQSLLTDVSQFAQENTFNGTVGTDDKGNNIFMIGKYRGVLITDVIKNDPDWVSWLVKEKADNDFFLFIKKEYNKTKEK